MKATKKHKRHKRSYLISLCLLCFFVAVSSSLTYAQTPSVAKVDPPSWWARHTINPVRVLVRGTGLRGARVRPLNPELSASGVAVNEGGTYLFVDVEIS